jgi:hypothetical protein
MIDKVMESHRHCWCGLEECLFLFWSSSFPLGQSPFQFSLMYNLGATLAWCRTSCQVAPSNCSITKTRICNKLWTLFVCTVCTSFGRISLFWDICQIMISKTFFYMSDKDITYFILKNRYPDWILDFHIFQSDSDISVSGYLSFIY